MPINEYIKVLSNNYKNGDATEYTYRGYLQNLLDKITENKGISVTNEPKRIRCGAPDYVVKRGEIPIGYIEAKDIGANLDEIEKSEQIKRYLKSIGENIILTDYLEFRFFRNSKKIGTIKIAEIKDSAIVPLPKSFDMFLGYIGDFMRFAGQTIKNSQELAQIMAKKARLIEEVLYRTLLDEDNNEIKNQFTTFQKMLIHGLSEREFADIYAQTIAYGMFSARLHDETLDTFTRQESLFLIPKSNPFLVKLFSYIAGPELDSRVVWVVDDLADIFRASDVSALMADFGKSIGQNDPFLHFYETFLAAYDPRLRKSRGVYYTPISAVRFIVNAVDEILKDEFKIQDGLASTEKTTIEKIENGTDKSRKSIEYKEKKILHKVQILDPATGTGTFLAEVVKKIYESFEGQEGIWNSYVDEEILPRVHGFEILMASYTMCHLKIEMLLKETGYRAKDEDKQKRLRVFLTNSLEETPDKPKDIFSPLLSSEANEATDIKKNVPVMVVLGNPPYSGESKNNSEWISDLMADYKKEPKTKETLKERNSKWINDDYAKFIRCGEHYVEKNGEGILAYINNHSFLDNPTFRGMRYHLLETFDKIYILDLHGNSKKKETSPDGSEDENVFDIQVGVSINIFIKTGTKKKGKLAEVYHYDLYGKREKKYKFLLEKTLKTVKFKKIPLKHDKYFFVRKNFAKEREYNKGFKVSDLFKINGVGITTAHDEFVIDDDKSTLYKRFFDFQNSKRDADFLHRKFKVKEKEGWNILSGYDNIKNEKDLYKYIIPISYRLFDVKHIFYEDNLVWRVVKKVMKHFLAGKNVGLCLSKQFKTGKSYQHIFVSNLIIESSFTSNKTSEITSTFPLYLYADENEMDGNKREPNLDEKIVREFEDRLSLTFTPEPTNKKSCFSPYDILDYIYAVLHSPSYREKYMEFLKIDFPRVPYPKDKDTFMKLVEIGNTLRHIHLLEDSIVSNPITKYPISGNNIVEKVIFSNGRVYINDSQYFEDVPKEAWDFYIGGYQPAQKWLKDRKGKELKAEEIMYYQKIIVALTETLKIMRKIDAISFE